MATMANDTGSRPTSRRTPVGNKTGPGAIEACLMRIAQGVYAREKALPVLERGCPEWCAWRDWRVAHGLPVSLMEASERWTVPLRSPPHDLEAVEAECAQGSCIAALLKKADTS